MSKATEDELGKLHSLLAQVLAAQVSDCVTFTDDETGEDKTVYTATPATLAAARQFLSDNSISCDAAEEDVNNLQKILESRRQDGKAQLKAVGED